MVRPYGALSVLLKKRAVPDTAFVSFRDIPRVGSLTLRLNADTLALKCNYAFDKGEKGIIPAHTDIFAWVKTSAALPHND